jgi:ANTAR domain-containing protein
VNAENSSKARQVALPPQLAVIDRVRCRVRCKGLKKQPALRHGGLSACHPRPHEAVHVHALVSLTLDQSPLGLATLYADIGRELLAPGTRTDALSAVTRVAVTRIPGVEWASITEGINGRFSTVVETDVRARLADEIQYELGTGPCVDAIVNDTTFRTGRLEIDERWPEFSRRASEAFGVHSMLSFRLYLEDDSRIAGLNLYSTSADAFDDSAETVGTLVATHGAVVIAAATAREQATQLQTALVNSREIGMAMGVVMATYKLAREQAFDLLRVASQNTNRKLADIATDVIDTGTMNLPNDRTGRSARRSPDRARGSGRPSSTP